MNIPSCVLAACLVGLLPVQVAAAPLVFTERAINPSVNDLRDLISADVDGDGDRDLIAASYADNRLVWLENDGAAVPGFAPRSLADRTGSNPAAGPLALGAADLDGDGDLDVVCASRLDRELAWYENLGGPRWRFAPHTIDVSEQPWDALVVTDLDGDSDPDIVAGNARCAANDCMTATGEIVWFENRTRAVRAGASPVRPPQAGAGPAVFVRHRLATRAAQHIRALDVDGDRDCDVLAASGLCRDLGCGSLVGGLVWLERQGGEFVPHNTTVPPVQAIALCDVDRDGRDNVMVSLPGESAIRWLDWHQGTLVEHTVGEQIGWVSALASGDVNGDGAPDVLAALETPGHIVWFAGDGAAIPSFSRETLAAAQGVRVLIAEDHNGDGRADLVVGSAGSVADRIDVYTNDGAALPTFVRHSVTSGLAGTPALAVGDVNGDGLVDLVTTSSRDGKLAWFEWDAGRTAFAPRTVAVQAADIRSTAAADIDGDGDNDLVAALRYDARVLLFANDGGIFPQFSPQVAADGMTGVEAVLVADLDGDGDEDIACAGTEIRWLEQRAGAVSTFHQHPIAGGDPLASALALGDLDRDGDIDLVTGAWSQGALIWHENDGHRPPTFVARVIDSVPGVRDLRIVDVNLDGFSDILGVSEIEGSVWWYAHDGTPAPSFMRRTIDEGLRGALAAQAADFDEDGDVDVVAAAGRDNRVIWYEHLPGTREFVAHPISEYVAGAYAVAVLDAEGDGDWDIFAAAPGERRVVWFENRRGEPMASNPVFDANGDGRIDAADLLLFLGDMHRPTQPVIHRFRRVDPAE